MSRQFGVMGWRGRLIFDAYLRLPDGMGTNREATDSYVDLAECRGHSLPVTTTGWAKAGPEAGLRGEVQRLSSDAVNYFNGHWDFKRPDLFRRIERSRWGLREEVYNQAKTLNIDSQSLLAGEILVQHPNLAPNFLANDKFDRQKIYLMECLAPVPTGQRLVKIGIGYDEFHRVKQLQTGNPYPIVAHFCISCRQSAALEDKLHKLLKSNQMLGEWFNITLDNFEAIGGVMIKHAMGMV